MFAAMNVLRRGLDSALAEHEAASAEDQATARRALGRILDLELAIMLHTYREDLLAQRSRIERLATFGQMAASIGHELRNPLGVIESSLFLLRGRVQSDDRATKQVDRIGQQVEIASGIITGLLGLIRDKPLVREPLQIDRLMEDALALVTRAPEVQILSSGLSGFPPLHGDPAQLRQVFFNLIDNAVQAATPVGAQVQIAAVVEGTSLAISVEDGGPGVSPEIGARLFEPLITSKPNGTGLGLSFALRIVERHHGTLSYEPRERGARFVVRLPLEA
jgi:two-component system sensor histidine kinase HydH